MLFVREYTAKSLDRSSVSMIDKYNVRLDIVGELLDKLSALIDNLLSLIRDIRYLLGQSKQRIYDNLDQVKEVIEGNDITGTESTVDAIESALEAGDKAIDEAETTLEGIAAAIECSEEYCNDDSGCNDSNIEVSCGETCNETPSETDDCSYCSFTATTIDCDNEANCSVCSQDGCVVDVNCNEETNIPGETIDVIGGDGGCTYSVTTDSTCNEATSYDAGCDEMNCNHSGDASSADGCNFSCAHSSGCYESGMPPNCTYSCIDDGCSYDSNDCSYGSTCGQAESCNQYDCSEYDCGEPCGETCHMTSDDCSESCSEDCSEDCGEGACNQFDCSEYDCGEPCGESCGLL